MTARQEALAKFEAIRAESKQSLDEIEAPIRAMECLFGITTADVRRVIRQAQQEGRQTSEIVIPANKPGVISTWYGHKIIFGDKLEAR